MDPGRDHSQVCSRLAGAALSVTAQVTVEKEWVDVRNYIVRPWAGSLQLTTVSELSTLVSEVFSSVPVAGCIERSPPTIHRHNSILITKK